MKNTLNNLILGIFLALISQGIQAQFDDIYYDPDRNVSSKEIKKETREDLYKDSYEDENDVSSQRDDYSYDDEYSEWEDQDYYYSSRIKRFHRPYRGFDYYNGCYVDNYYYDPFDFNPWYYDMNIYVSNYGYRDYHHWRRWQMSPIYGHSYWNQWDWYAGWSSYPLTFSYSYWPNHCYSGYYNNHWAYNNYYYNPYYGGGYNHWNNYNNNGNYDNHPNGTYFGSRKHGLTNSSNRGPVRVLGTSPKEFTEASGTSTTPGRESGSPRRKVTSADGDVLSPQPTTRPDRVRDIPGTKPNPNSSDRENPRYTPREIPGDNKLPSESTRPNPRSDFKPERQERVDERPQEFKPERTHRDDPRRERSESPAPRMETPREKSRDSYEAPRESRPEPPRMEKRQEYNNSNSRSSEPSGSRSSGGSKSDNNNSSGNGRKGPR